jgi:hypothetical protein
MLFGLGWPSILFFFLSMLPFTAKAQGLLLTFGWLFCSCWWLCAASGFLTENKTKAQESVFIANYFTAGIGSVLGAVLSASYAVYNWPWMYIFSGFAVAVGGVLALRAVDDGTGSKAASPEGEGAAAGAAAAGNTAAEVGDLIDLNSSE